MRPKLSSLLLLLALACSGQVYLSGNVTISGTGNWRVDQCYNFGFVDFEAGTDGTQATATTLLNSMHGFLGNFSPYSGSHVFSFFDSLGQKALSNPFILCTNGATVTGSGSLGIRSDTVLSPTNAWKFQPGVYAPAASAGMWFYTDLPMTNTSFWDWCCIFGTNQTDYCNTPIYGNGTTLRLSMETKNGCNTGQQTISFSNSNWYWVTLRLDLNNPSSIALYNSSGAKLGQMDCSTGALGAPVNFTFGFFAHGAYITPYHIWIDSLKMDWVNATFPLLP